MIWLNKGNSRIVPIFGLLLANDFGGNIFNYEESRLLYYLLGSWEIFYQAQCIQDDIEDWSLKRWGEDWTHIKYGVGIAINTSSLLIYLCFYRLKSFIDQNDMMYQKIMNYFTEGWVNFYFGQSLDIDWLDGSFIPNEENYYQMSSLKTGGLCKLITKLMWTLYNEDNQRMTKLVEMMDKFSIAFQINNDLVSLESSEYAVERGTLSDDIREGKRSLIVIHSYKNLNEISKKRLLDILSMKTENIELIVEAIELLNSTKSIEYAKKTKDKIVDSILHDSCELLKKDESKTNFEQFIKLIM